MFDWKKVKAIKPLADSETEKDAEIVAHYIVKLGSNRKNFEALQDMADTEDNLKIMKKYFRHAVHVALGEGDWTDISEEYAFAGAVLWYLNESKNSLLRSVADDLLFDPREDSDIDDEAEYGEDVWESEDDSE